MAGLSIIGGILGVGVLLVIHGTIFKTRWGINTATQIECPAVIEYTLKLVPLAVYDKLYGRRHS